MFVKEYLVTDSGSIVVKHGKLCYKKITMIPDNTSETDNFDAPWRCPLYEDYAYCFPNDTKEPQSFYEITLIEVDADYRRQGIGTLLQKRFFDEIKPNIILGYYGITSKELYESFMEGGSNEDKDIMQYLRDNNEKFGKTFGFVTVDDIIPRSESIPFVWPEKEAIRMRKVHKEKYEKWKAKETNMFE